MTNSCNPKCPNHAEFDLEKTAFPHFCVDCYIRISKMHKPRLEPRKLPPEVIRAYEQELQNKAQARERNGNEDEGTISPRDPAGDRKSINRPRCDVCNARLSLFAVGCVRCQKYECENHKDQHECSVY